MRLNTLERPPALSGEPEEQMREMRRYMERLVEGIEENLRILGDGALTKKESAEIRNLIGQQ